MANPEHVEVLAKSIKEGDGLRSFNAWVQVRRKEDSEFVVNLDGADLRHANLAGVNLDFANLRGAKLSNANLSNASLRSAFLRGAILNRARLDHSDLYGANLAKADLCAADLSGANLVRTDMYGVDLSGADLASAYLYAANLNHALLKGADLQGANLIRTDLSNTDLAGANLTGVRNLDTANLEGAIFLNATVSQRYKARIEEMYKQVIQSVHYVEDEVAEEPSMPDIPEEGGM